MTSVGFPSRRIRRQRSEDGFGLVEALIGMVILMVVVVSLSTLLIDSLTTALANKQREAAASLASDAAENGEALGRTCLIGGTCPAFTASTFALVKGTEASFVTASSYTVDRIVYTVTPTVTCGGVSCTTASSGAVLVTVGVSWAQAARIFTFYTSTLVGA